MKHYTDDMLMEYYSLLAKELGREPKLSDIDAARRAIGDAEGLPTGNTFAAHFGSIGEVRKAYGRWRTDVVRIARAEGVDYFTVRTLTSYLVGRGELDTFTMQMEEGLPIKYLTFISEHFPELYGRMGVKKEAAEAAGLGRRPVGVELGTKQRRDESGDRFESTVLRVVWNDGRKD